ncbi:hypothetical protein [Serratia liquefaciens]|uniref:hypothetical protein n=1 Tax=Serratia liquefaciens TaxID=614 RepID=UPI00372AEDE6
MSILNISNSTQIKIDFSNAILTMNFIKNAGYVIKTIATKISNSIIFTPNTTQKFQGITQSHNGVRNIIFFNKNEQFILTCSRHAYNTVSNEDEFTITHVLNGTTGLLLSLSPTECITIYP